MMRLAPTRTQADLVTGHENANASADRYLSLTWLCIDTITAGVMAVWIPAQLLDFRQKLVCKQVEWRACSVVTEALSSKGSRNRYRLWLKGRWVTPPLAYNLLRPDSMANFTAALVPKYWISSWDATMKHETDLAYLGQNTYNDIYAL